MLFLFPPKLNDDFVFQDNSNVMEVEAGAVTTYLTWEAIKAAAVAAGSAVAPVAIGIVGAAAIGWVVDETIGWDTIADFGQGVIDDITGKGGSVEDIYDAETETVRLTPEFVAGTAVAIDDVPTRHITNNNGWQIIGDMTHGSSLAFSVSVPLNYYIYFRADIISETGSRFDVSMSTKSKYFDDSGSVTTTSHPVLNRSFDLTTDFPITVNGRVRANSDREFYELTSSVSPYKLNDYVRFSNVRYKIYSDSVAIPDDITYSDNLAIKETLPDNIDERKEIIINNISNIGAIPLQDNQAVTGVTFDEMAAGTETDEGLDNDLGILGMLAQIYNYIKTLPNRIVGAFTSLFNTIINAILAIPDVITSGVDNLLININALGNSIADGFGGLLINLGTWFDGLINGVGSITGAITDALQGLKSWLGLQWESLMGLLSNIWDFIAGLAEWIIALVVPTSLAAIQPSITSLNNTFNQKFEFILFPIRSFGNAYSESKSLYDVTFNLKYKDIDKDVHVLPIAFKPAVDVLRLVANGVGVVLTYISIYNRFRKEVVAG